MISILYSQQNLKCRIEKRNDALVSPILSCGGTINYNVIREVDLACVA